MAILFDYFLTKLSGLRAIYQIVKDIFDVINKQLLLICTALDIYNHTFVGEQKNTNCKQEPLLKL